MGGVRAPVLMCLIRNGVQGCSRVEIRSARGPFPAPMPLSPSFVFVPAALLVACLAVLVLQVSLVGYVSESSWETDFRGDEFQTGGALWCEVSFPSDVSESKMNFLNQVRWNKVFPFLLKGQGKLCVFVINADMTIEDLEHSIQK